MFALDVADVSVLDTLSFQADEILQILRKTDIEPQLKIRKSKGGSARSKFNLQQISLRTIRLLLCKILGHSRCGWSVG